MLPQYTNNSYVGIYIYNVLCMCYLTYVVDVIDVDRFCTVLDMLYDVSHVLFMWIQYGPVIHCWSWPSSGFSAFATGGEAAGGDILRVSRWAWSCPKGTWVRCEMCQVRWTGSKWDIYNHYNHFTTYIIHLPSFATLIRLSQSVCLCFFDHTRSIAVFPAQRV